jgi:hypothetical protein
MNIGETISRREVAELIGMDSNRLGTMIAMCKAYQNFPSHVGKKSYYFLYKTDEVVKFLVDEGIMNMEEILAKIQGGKIENPMGFRDFISGKFDRDELTNRYKLKRLASKVTKPKTVRVSIECEWAF